jgi:hypothetical protein
LAGSRFANATTKVQKGLKKNQYAPTKFSQLAELVGPAMDVTISNRFLGKAKVYSR